MAKLLMISGDRALAQGKQGAFYNTLEEFRKYWERIDIICPKPETYSLKPITYFGNVFIHTSPWPIILQPLWILKKGQALFRENKFDLITVHEYPPFYNGIGTRLLWNKIKIPYVLEIFHIPGYPKSANLKEKIYLSLIKVFIKWDSHRAVAVRVMNKKQVPNFLMQYGIPQSKIKYIPALYIDLGIFKPAAVGKEFDLLFVGRLAENKGLDIFLEAVKRGDFKAAIVGDGPLRNFVNRNTRNSKKITYLGWLKTREELAHIINKSKILVAPSFNEGGPRVVGESLACGVPVLATPVGIVPDVIEEGKSGGIIGWQLDDIVLKAQELLSNPEKYNRYSRVGIEIAKQFGKKAAIKNYAEKLKELLNKDLP